MKSEIHIVLVWEKGLDQIDPILSDLKDNFQILDVSKVNWSDAFFSNNLSRFYGEKLSDGSFKEKHCGRGPFVVIILKQDNPIYDFRKTSRGDERVNSILFDKKEIYRGWTGGGHKVHASNNILESSHDIFFLFQKSLNHFLNKDEWGGVIEDKVVDIAGYNGWVDFNELFNFINKVSGYVILRNYDNLEQLPIDSDIDFLSSDLDFHYHINGSRKYKYKNRAAYKVAIGKDNRDVDVRLINDGYYDPNWTLDIIKNRILYKNKFFIPDPINEFYSLLYHVLIHKNDLSDKYNKRLIQLASKIELKIDTHCIGDRSKMLSLLEDFLIAKGYEITNPNDFSVQYNYAKKGFKRILWEMIGRIKNG